jgi:hypothetical protein
MDGLRHQLRRLRADPVIEMDLLALLSGRLQWVPRSLDRPTYKPLRSAAQIEVRLFPLAHVDLIPALSSLAAGLYDDLTLMSGSKRAGVDLRSQSLWLVTSCHLHRIRRSHEVDSFRGVVEK